MNSSLENAIRIIVENTHPDKIVLFGSRSGKQYQSDSDYDIVRETAKTLGMDVTSAEAAGK